LVGCQLRAAGAGAVLHDDRERLQALYDRGDLADDFVTAIFASEPAMASMFPWGGSVVRRCEIVWALLEATAVRVR